MIIIPNVNGLFSRSCDCDCDCDCWVKRFNAIKSTSSNKFLFNQIMINLTREV